MAECVVRIESVKINHFKNVEDGFIEFENRHKPYKASVLGLYGQNGSGKTALIDALSFLKTVLTGAPLNTRYADFIRVGAASAELEFTFRVKYDLLEYRVWYRFCLKKVEGNPSVQGEDSGEMGSSLHAEIVDESISFSYCDGEKSHRKTLLLDTNLDVPFMPKVRWNEMAEKENDVYTELVVNRRLTRLTSRSFLFSKEMLQFWEKHMGKCTHLRLLSALAHFASSEFFVIGTLNTGLISMNALPLMFKFRNEEKETVGRIFLSLDKPTSVPETACHLVQNVINNLNIVLEQLVPGLKIGILDLGLQISQNGDAVKLIQLVSLKNEKAIPFCYESEGIKKIVSILQLLVVVYNYPSVTVAIDELDSGVYEYLLGELLRIISEQGKGQLIFTSHNLRPLETIDKGFVAFTTTNPKNRYIRLENVKSSNNLRSFYYRDILLGEQKEQIYFPTDNLDIAFAFREAGEAFGS